MMRLIGEDNHINLKAQGQLNRPLEPILRNL